MPSKPCVSIVVPLYNEEELLDELVERLMKLDDTEVQWEYVFVNDGSTDATLPQLKSLIRKYGRGKLVDLSRNFGQQAAFRAGLEYATGDAVVLMDGDLQDPPEFIPQMVEAWQNGANSVTACRTSRQERGLRRFLFDRFHWLFSRLTGGAMPPNSGTFGLMDRKVADHVKELSEVSLFLPALRHWPGYNQQIVWYARQERVAGETKQSLTRLFAYAWDGIISFSELPLQWITIVGMLVSLAGFAYAAVLIGQRILQLMGYLKGLEVLGFTTIIVAILCIGGLQLIALGILGQYIARIYREAKKRPLYLVKEIITPATLAESIDSPDSMFRTDAPEELATPMNSLPTRVPR